MSPFKEILDLEALDTLLAKMKSVDTAITHECASVLEAVQNTLPNTAVDPGLPQVWGPDIFQMQSKNNQNLLQQLSATLHSIDKAIDSQKGMFGGLSADLASISDLLKKIVKDIPWHTVQNAIEESNPLFKTVGALEANGHNYLACALLVVEGAEIVGLATRILTPQMGKLFNNFANTCITELNAYLDGLKSSAIETATPAASIKQSDSSKPSKVLLRTRGVTDAELKEAATQTAPSSNTLRHHASGSEAQRTKLSKLHKELLSTQKNRAAVDGTEDIIPLEVVFSTEEKSFHTRLNTNPVVAPKARVTGGSSAATDTEDKKFQPRREATSRM